MSRPDTVRHTPSWLARWGLAVLAAWIPVAAQNAPEPAWRPVGNTLRLLGLPSPAGGPVERLWFSADGRLHLELAGGRAFVTRDWETWAVSAEAAPPRLGALRSTRLEAGRPVWEVAAPSGYLYAGGAHLYRSADQGRTWANLTEWQGESLLGAAVRDIAPDPGDDQRVAVATSTGIWLTHDGGRTWIGLNEGLPNLPVRRLVQLPEGGRRLRVAVAAGEGEQVLDWIPGQRAGWAPAREGDAREALRGRLSARFGVEVAAAAAAGEVTYAATPGGVLRASVDGGRTWRTFTFEGAEAERFWVDAEDGRVALAALRSADGTRGMVLRTLNGGIWWDDLTAGLAAGPVYGLAADRETGAIYAATARGLYWTVGDLRAPAPATAWAALPGLPAGAAVRDVALDEAGVRVFAAVEGYGIQVAAAPHRQLRPAAVHTADFGRRAAAPGALLSVFGAGARAASAGGRPAAVLAAEPGETQLQIPFDVSGETLSLDLAAGAAPVSLSLLLRDSSPAILIDRDGTPMLLDAESGLPLDAANPGRPGMTVQILATGLGRVDPDWPAGMPAPLEGAPRVRARVRVVLDGMELPVLSATLAPGYTGYYLVEARLPDFLDSGLGVVVVEAGGNASPPAGIHLEQ